MAAYAMPRRGVPRAKIGRPRIIAGFPSAACRSHALATGAANRPFIVSAAPRGHGTPA